MKKYAIILLTLAVLLSFAACRDSDSGVVSSGSATGVASGDSGSASSAGEALPVAAGEFDAEVAAGMMDVTEYRYSDDYYHYLLLVVKNNSGYDISLSANATVFNANGDELATDVGSDPCVENGAEVLLEIPFSEPFDSATYQLRVEDLYFYKGINSSISYEVSQEADKVVLTATNNNADIPAMYVDAFVLFFSGDELVYLNDEYFMDDNSELKPGESMTQEIKSRAAFDSVKVYIKAMSETPSN